MKNGGLRASDVMSCAGTVTPMILTVNQLVVGSIPTAGAKDFKDYPSADIYPAETRPPSLTPRLSTSIKAGNPQNDPRADKYE